MSDIINVTLTYTTPEGHLRAAILEAIPMQPSDRPDDIVQVLAAVIIRLHDRIGTLERVIEEMAAPQPGATMDEAADQPPSHPYPANLEDIVVDEFGPSQGYDEPWVADPIYTGN